MGAAFLITQVELFLKVELFCLQSIEVLIRRTSQCKQKALIVSKNLPNTTVSKKLHCKQEAPSCKQKSFVPAKSLHMLEGFKKALRGLLVEAPSPIRAHFLGESVWILWVCPAVTPTFGV